MALFKDTGLERFILEFHVALGRVGWWGGFVRASGSGFRVRLRILRVECFKSHR